MLHRTMSNRGRIVIHDVRICAHVTRFYKPYPKSYHLEVLATSPKHRNKGAASALVQWAIDAAAKEDAIVGTEPGTQAAGFYRKMGFVTVGELFLEDPKNPGRTLGVPVARHVK